MLHPNQQNKLVSARYRLIFLHWPIPVFFIGPDENVDLVLWPQIRRRTINLVLLHQNIDVKTPRFSATIILYTSHMLAMATLLWTRCLPVLTFGLVTYMYSFHAGTTNIREAICNDSQLRIVPNLKVHVSLGHYQRIQNISTPLCSFVFFSWLSRKTVCFTYINTQSSTHDYKQIISNCDKQPIMWVTHTSPLSVKLQQPKLAKQTTQRDSFQRDIPTTKKPETCFRTLNHSQSSIRKSTT